MKDSKLLDALRTLDERELAAFHKYLTGNYSRQKIALDVFMYIKRFHPDYSDEKKLDIAFAHKKIFRTDILEDDYNRTKLLNALSDLNIWLNEFLLWNKIRDGSYESQALWLMVAKERGLQKAYEKQYKKIREQLAKSEKRSTSDILAGLLANYLFYYSPLEKISTPNIDALLKCVDDLDSYYAIARLKIACETANVSHLLHIDIPPSMLNATESLLKWSHLAEEPLFEVYREIYLLISTGNFDSFFKIETWVDNNHNTISALELHDIISYLNNYAARLLRLDERKNAPVIHKINKFAFSNGFFQQRKEISSAQFNNVVNLACSQGDLDWANQFITTCSPFLRPDNHLATVELARAIVLFEQKQYEAVSDMLANIDTSDISIAIRAKSLIIRCLFELKESDLFYSRCQAFETYLYRNQIIRPEWLRATLNFIRLLKLLFEENTPREGMISKITHTKELYYREWLLEKASSYKGRFAAQKRKSR